MKNNRPCGVFLTVGDSRQKKLCESLVYETEVKHNIKLHIVSDDELGCRIGSGGAVLKIIEENYKENSKIIVINSGGMSKRAVNFALKGKALAGVNVNGEEKLMLDLLVENALRLSSKTESGILVCCSDIPIDAQGVNCLPCGNIGFCIATDTNVGSRHGVLFANEKGETVCFAHKKSSDELENLMRRFGRNDVLTDTGWVFLDDEFCKTARRFCTDSNLLKIISDKKCEINLYSDIIPLLAKEVDENEYFSSSETDADVKKILFNAFSRQQISAYELENSRFMHFGSVKEYLENIFYLSGTSEGAVNVNSYVDSTVKIGESTVLDTALIKGNSRIGKRCLISDVSLSDVVVPDEKSVCGFRQTDGSFITAVCDIYENPKTVFNGTEFWDLPRFCKAKSFSESYGKFMNGCDGKRYSLRECVENADFRYVQSFSKYLRGLQSHSLNDSYREKRENILNRFLSLRKAVDVAECIKEKSEIYLPVRVNLSGTWTDAMPYCVDNGGAVINAAVTVEEKLPIFVKTERIREQKIEFVSDRHSLETNLDDVDTQEYFSDFNLHFAVLKTLGIDKNTRLKNGFRLTTCVTGLEKGSGLGTSSILLAGCFRTLGEVLGFDYTDGEITEMVFIAEQIMNTGGGWQDQTGALYPGVKISVSESGEKQSVSVREIPLTDRMKAIFDERAVLVPTGERHFGRFVVGDVADRYLRAVPEAVKALSEIKDLNKEMEKSLINSDEKQFFECLNKHCSLLKKISHKVTTPQIDRLIARLGEVAEAVSVCGAGAGGYLLAFVKNKSDIEQIKTLMKTEFEFIKSDVLKIKLYEKP